MVLVGNESLRERILSGEIAAQAMRLIFPFAFAVFETARSWPTWTHVPWRHRLSRHTAAYSKDAKSLEENALCTSTVQTQILCKFEHRV